MTPRIYLAAPLFNERERLFNLRLCERIERLAPVFLPQRNGALLAALLTDGVPASIAERRVYEQDTRALRSVELVVAVLDGAHVDEGVAFEIGFVRALGMPCVALQTDVRRALPSGNNPMLSQALSAIFGTEEELFEWIAGWASQGCSALGAWRTPSRQVPPYALDR